MSDDLPRILVVSNTGIGSDSATGQLMAMLFSDWPPDSVFSLYASPRPCAPYEGIEARGAVAASDVAKIVEVVRAFEPDLIYYKPVEDAVFFRVAHEVIRSLQAPLVVHVMDDWIEKLRFDDPLAFRSMNDKIQVIYDRADAHLAISEAMADAYETRYGYPFRAFANAVDTERARPERPSAGRREDEPFVFRYSGSLAPNMTLSAVTKAAEAISALSTRRRVELHVSTMPWFQDALEDLARLPGVAAKPFLSSEMYQRALTNADALLIAYNFDAPSRAYTRFSMSNKLPEFLVSGTPLFAFGPPDINTISCINEARTGLVVTDDDIDVLKEALSKFMDDTQMRAELAANAFAYAASHLDRTKTKQGFMAVITNATRSGGWFPGLRISSRDPGLIGSHPRSENLHYDETRLVADLHAGSPGTMIDVGAHHGSAFKPFLDKGWRVHAFEPDPTNRKYIEQHYVKTPNLWLDNRAVSDQDRDGVPFYASDESTGISGLSAFRDSHEQVDTVATVTLDTYCRQHDIEEVDFLKIDTEGFDLMVLKGFPWSRLKPKIVECEFEDSKTVPLGYRFHDLAGFLVQQGYVLYISEWHPVIRYGVQHQWRRLVKYPAKLANRAMWGNIVAFREQPDETALAAKARELLGLDAKRAVSAPEPEDERMPNRYVSSAINYVSVVWDFVRSVPGLITVACLATMFVIDPLLSRAAAYVPAWVTPAIGGFIQFAAALFLLSYLYSRLRHEIYQRTARLEELIQEQRMLEEERRKQVGKDLNTVNSQATAASRDVERISQQFKTLADECELLKESRQDDPKVKGKIDGLSEKVNAVETMTRELRGEFPKLTRKLLQMRAEMLRSTGYESKSMAAND